MFVLHLWGTRMAVTYKSKKKYKTKLQQMRKWRNISQKKLAEITGIPLATIRAYEQDRIPLRNAPAYRVQQLAHALSVSMDVLMKEPESIFDD